MSAAEPLALVLREGMRTPTKLARTKNSAPERFDAWELLSDDVIVHLFELLGLDALNLRQVSCRFSKTRLPCGIELAFQALKMKPDTHIDNHKKRLPTPTCSMIKWDRTKLEEGRAYRIEWARLVHLIDAVPINTVIDAFLHIPKYNNPRSKTQQPPWSELQAEIQFFHDCVNKPTPLRNRSTSPVTTTGPMKRKAEWISSQGEMQTMWNGLSDEKKRQYCAHHDPAPKEQERESSKHACRVRAVLHKCIEARLWDVITGHDVIKTRPNDPVRIVMSNESVLETVKRMFSDDVRVHNGPSSFFYTQNGWLGFTPFLLAAERQNLPLAKHLEETCSPAITVNSRSQAGNSAYALSRAYLKEMRRTPNDLKASEMLAYLTELGLPIRAKRNEYHAWAC